MLAHVLNNMDASRTALLNGRGRIGRWRGRSAFDQPRAHTGAASGHEHRHAAFRSVAPGPVSLHGRARGVQSIRCPACQRQSADERPSTSINRILPHASRRGGSEAWTTPEPLCGVGARGSLEDRIQWPWRRLSQSLSSCR